MPTSKSYSEKLKDPGWQKKRLEILTRDGWACQVCGDQESTLNVHHKLYFPNKDPWEIDSEFLVTLYEGCHGLEKAQMAESLNLLGQLLKEKFLSPDVWLIMEGFLDIKMPHHPEVTAKIIRWALSDFNTMKLISDQYFEYLSMRQKAKNQ